MVREEYMWKMPEKSCGENNFELREK